MSYATYTTHAIVCGSSASKTSDKTFLLFTREAGVLFATARSVREEASKQRPALQDFSQVRVSIVKGKGGWRVGSVEALGNAFMECGTREARAAIAHLTKLIRRYVHGESPIPDVFDDFLDALRLVVHNEVMQRDEIVALFHIRLLARLGYVPRSAILAPVLEGGLGASVDRLNPSLITHIDRATEAASVASHL